jgi:hypothetical protein
MTAVADPSNFNRAKEQSLENQAQLFQQLQSFPHIAVRIREMWGTQELDVYLNGLLFAGRLDRQGFPREVASTLFKLIMANDAFIEEVFAR